MLNAISLFSGIGGFELGLAGYVRTVLYCEADHHAQSVLISRMATGDIDIAPISTDVREITSSYIDIPIDIIFGGFPCQDISVAGKGVGLEGKRSGLFYEIVRLADEIKPTFLFLENVPAIRTRGLDSVIQELTKIGYDCRWCMLSAAQVGAKHKRERWFCLARDTASNRSDTVGTVSQGTATLARGVCPNVANTDGKQLRDNGRQALIDDNGEQRLMADTKGGGNILGKSRDMGKEISGGACFDTAAIEGYPNLADTGGQRIRSDIRTIPRKQNQGDEVRRSMLHKRPTQPDMGRVVNGFSTSLVESIPNYLTSDYWKEEPADIPRVTEDKEQRIERLKRLGNGVVPLQVRTAFEYLMGITDRAEY